MPIYAVGTVSLAHVPFPMPTATTARTTCERRPVLGGTAATAAACNQSKNRAIFPIYPARCRTRSPRPYDNLIHARRNE